jgi:hypothetical protein
MGWGWDKWGQYILMSDGMKFRNKKKFRYGIPAHTGSFQATIISTHNMMKKYVNFYNMQMVIRVT